MTIRPFLPLQELCENPDLNFACHLQVFDELQLDAEWSLNVGNWLWLSGSAFVKEHIPWFCPVEVGKKIDPSGEYVR